MASDSVNKDGYPFVSIIRTVLHRNLVEAICWYYRYFWKMKIGKKCRISLRARLDKTNPKGIDIGDYTMIAFDAVVLTHDFVNQRHVTTRIGDYCFIGCGAAIMPGITIGDHCIVGARSVVTRDVPSRSIVAGNPARVLATGIDTVAWGMRPREPENAPVAAPADAAQ